MNPQLMLRQNPRARAVYEIICEHPEGITALQIGERLDLPERERAGVIRRLHNAGLIRKAGLDTETSRTVWRGA